MLPDVVVIVGCLLLGLVGLTRAGLWADELATWGKTTVSWSELWGPLARTDPPRGASLIEALPANVEAVADHPTTDRGGYVAVHAG